MELDEAPRPRQPLPDHPTTPLAALATAASASAMTAPAAAAPPTTASGPQPQLPVPPPPPTAQASRSPQAIAPKLTGTAAASNKRKRPAGEAPRFRPRACERCSVSKLKCNWSSEPGEAPCDRCARSMHECVLPSLKPRGPRRGNPNKVGQLEQKIDGLMSLLVQTKKEKSDADDEPASTSANGNGHPASAMPTPGRGHSQSDASMHGAGSPPAARAAQSSSPSGHAARPSHEYLSEHQAGSQLAGLSNRPVSPASTVPSVRSSDASRTQLPAMDFKEFKDFKDYKDPKTEASEPAPARYVLPQPRPSHMAMGHASPPSVVLPPLGQAALTLPPITAASSRPSAPPPTSTTPAPPAYRDVVVVPDLLYLSPNEASRALYDYRQLWQPSFPFVDVSDATLAEAPLVASIALLVATNTTADVQGRAVRWLREQLAHAVVSAGELRLDLVQACLLFHVWLETPLLEPRQVLLQLAVGAVDQMNLLVGWLRTRPPAYTRAEARAVLGCFYLSAHGAIFRDRRQVFSVDSSTLDAICRRLALAADGHPDTDTDDKRVLALVALQRLALQATDAETGGHAFRHETYGFLGATTERLRRELAALARELAPDVRVTPAVGLHYAAAYVRVHAVALGQWNLSSTALADAWQALDDGLGVLSHVAITEPELLVAVPRAVLGPVLEHSTAVVARLLLENEAMRQSRSTSIPETAARLEDRLRLATRYCDAGSLAHSSLRMLADRMRQFRAWFLVLRDCMARDVDEWPGPAARELARGVAPDVFGAVFADALAEFRVV